jgi:tetratricopeptide (TPR) repeat protein
MGVTRIAIALPLILLAAALPARAAPIDDAKKAFAEGKAAFERGDYETALAAYQKANMILPAPNLYYNIGTTYERLVRYQEAALAFDKYFEMAGAPTTDEEKEFQEKLKSRTEADRKRPNRAPATGTTVQPPPMPPAPPPGTAGRPYYNYWMPPPQPPREERIREARGRRTRAIALMGVGVPFSVLGIILAGWAIGSPNLDTGQQWGVGFVGLSLVVVGVTLWAPGAASYVKSTNDLKKLNQPEPPPTAYAAPPSTRGF